MDWTVARVVAHAAQGPLWYAFDLSAGGSELSPLEITVRPDAKPADLVRTLSTTANMAAAVIDTAGPTATGFHPWGQSDPSGFAAMACDELLVHTDDAARGLGLTFEPDATVATIASRTLRRLFPDVELPDDVDPWRALLWANGRIELPGRPRRTKWQWHAASL
jgi:hypothetical protein